MIITIYKKIRKKQAFTLIELLIVIAIIAVIAAVVFVAIDPMFRLASARNNQRLGDATAIVEAIKLYSIDTKTEIISGIDGSLKMLGTASSGCSVVCDPDYIVATLSPNIFNNLLADIKEYSHVPLAQAFEPTENIQLTSNTPIIISAKSSPVKVVPGDVMLIEVNIEDAHGIESVIADIGSIETINLNLSHGDIYNGTWTAEWLVHDTELKRYITTITVINQQDIIAQEIIYWSDPLDDRWVLPTGHIDPNSQWISETNMYDDNTGSYGSNTYASTGWGEFIIFTLDTPLYSDRVRVNADYLDAYVEEVDIDVYKDGEWVNVFQGGNQNDWNCQWVDLLFTKGFVEQARFRYNYNQGGFNFWLYEFQFYEASDIVELPTCDTNNATSILNSSSILQGIIADDGGEICEYRFQYGIIPYFDIDTPWINGRTTGESFNKLLTGLSGATTYYFKAQAKNSAGTVSCGNKQLTTTSSSPSWVLPSNYQDIDNTWDNETQAFDDDTITYARSYHSVNTPQWSSYLYFSHATMLADKIKFYARAGSEVNSVDLDVYKDGLWEDVYEGIFSDKDWVEKTFTEGAVTQARIRFYATSASHGFFWELYEFHIYKSGNSVEDVTIDTCLDLSSFLVPKYLTAMPSDPQNDDLERTYYAIKKESGEKRIIVVACKAELGENISAIK